MIVCNIAVGRSRLQLVDLRADHQTRPRCLAPVDSILRLDSQSLANRPQPSPLKLQDCTRAHDRRGECLRDDARGRRAAGRLQVGRRRAGGRRQYLRHGVIEREAGSMRRNLRGAKKVRRMVRSWIVFKVIVAVFSRRRRDGTHYIGLICLLSLRHEPL